MKSWIQMANGIFNAVMISTMAQQAGIYIEPIMLGRPDGGMAILLERRGIVGGWEFTGGSTR